MKPSDRRLSSKFVKTPGGRTVKKAFRKGAKETTCALCSNKVQGTPKGKDSDIGKLSKTEKRPSVLFGGVLCNKCRDIIYEEAIKVKTDVKKINDVKVGSRGYVEQALNRIDL